MSGVYGLEQRSVLIFDELQDILLIINNKQSHALGVKINLFNHLVIIVNRSIVWSSGRCSCQLFGVLVAEPVCKVIRYLYCECGAGTFILFSLDCSVKDLNHQFGIREP